MKNPDKTENPVDYGAAAGYRNLIQTEMFQKQLVRFGKDVQ